MPFNLTSTGLPFPYTNDGTKFANLFNSLYGQPPPIGPTPAFTTAGGLFTYFSTGATAPTSTSLLLIGTVIDAINQQKLLSELVPSGSGTAASTATMLMQVLAGQWALQCTDQVWANFTW